MPIEENNFILRPGKDDNVEEGQKLRILVESDRQVLQKDILVTTACLDPVFKKPSDPSRKQIETTQGQLRPVDSDDPDDPTGRDDPGFAPEGISFFPPIGSNKNRQEKSGLSQWRSLDEYQGPYADLLESVAVAATKTQQLDFNEQLSCIANVYPHCRYEIFASLQDNGFIQTWYPINFHLPLYWVPTPSLVEVGENVVRVIGIVPKIQRSRLAQLCDQHSVDPFVSGLEGSEVLGAMELRGTTPEFLEALASQFGWRVSEGKPEPLAAFEEVLASSPSLSFELATENPEKKEIWDWHHRFKEIPEHNQIPSLNLQMFDDRACSNKYVLFDSEKVRWVTGSRRWAILMLAALEKKQLFSLSPSGDLCRNTDSHAFARSLPEAVGRYALLFGNGVSGPIVQDRQNTYVHCFENDTQAIDCCGDWIDSGDLESSPVVSLDIVPLSGEYPLCWICRFDSSFYYRRKPSWWI